MGEVLFFSIYVAQQLGVMLGVGAQTVLLCTHLLALHHKEAESPHASYAEAARKSLSVGFFLIIVSGLAAVAVHVLGGNEAILFAPAFVFKWVLILVVLCAFWLHGRLSRWSDILAWFAGGSWYALFLVHTLAPVTSWFNLAVLYFLWMVLFGIFWSAFVLLMRKTKPVRATSPLKAAAPVIVPKPKPLPPPPLISKPVPPPKPKLELPLAPHPLSLPTPLIVPIPPLPPKPVVPPVVITKEVPKHSMLHDVIDHLLVPALRIMPKTPADVGKQNRPPVVKLGDE